MNRTRTKKREHAPKNTDGRKKHIMQRVNEGEKLFEKRKKDQKSRRKGTNYRKVTQRARTKLKDIKEGGKHLSRKPRPC